MDEFKLQFKLHLIQGGSWKVNEGYGRKHYVARFTQGRFVVHHSAKSFKRAGDAIEYADKVLARYRRMAKAALEVFLESQDVQSTN